MWTDEAKTQGTSASKNDVTDTMYHDVIQNDLWPVVVVCASTDQGVAAKRKTYRGKMDNAADGDDEEADDDAGDGDVQGVPAQPSGPIVVTLVVTVSRLRTWNRR